MLTKTTELATKLLIFMAINGKGGPLSPRQAASALRSSPSYLAKTTALLVKAGILRSTRGAKGGVSLARPAEEISLLQIFEACQGLLTASYCRVLPSTSGTCSFHLAMEELHTAAVATLSRWTLSDLLEQPARCPEEGTSDCRMFFEGCGELNLDRAGQLTR